ncbi:spore cortex-lytic enzyme [Brevibacillus choshinensis]|uniref:Spore cortex-lytic enzyme n=1 Tax=Brevibacillus choshinensis TaxID=54911 RepID=A0ABX7FIN7_BRECH|nr:spore cortex-lytic enzyme [Brevibacillus choshinensis]QRG66091.1 spore cortex-lytic enzyme [Brevibacillus choshinensis]
MWLNKKTLTTLLLAILAVAIVMPTESFAATQLQRGSVNGDVWDVQYRLQMLGYYNDNLDGIYGSNTANAVRAFQRNYGLTADGVVGDDTWRVMKKVSVNRTEMQLLAQLVYSEARGESYVGQVAVAAVAMNRMQSANFPNTIREVIFEPYAFTAVDDGQFWLTPDVTAYRAAWDAVRGWDPSGGALYYFNPDTATSSWIWSRPQIKKIGKHIFAS